MLPETAASKVTATHLSRRALLYIRQSSLKQVIHNTESAIRQYDLRGKAISLGWDASQITVIDIDQGQSGASAADREGFQQLVAEVSLGRAGIVLGLECSRLARNSADWHQLLELCGLTGTLICDEDGLYDPRNFNDRLLLGLKGALSEAELHLIRARLRGGQISKARRGELVMLLPIGLVYDGAGHVILDPDTAIQGALRHLFTTFEAAGSATAVVKAFRAAGLSFPWRHHKGPRKGEVDWQPLLHSTVLRVLHNPRYAGAFTYGRTTHPILPGGKASTRHLPREEWTSFIPGAHPGYITLGQYEANIARLSANAAAHGRDRAAGPPREGPALLQGIIICGRCGNRMTVRYHARGGKDLPTYLCQRDGISNARRICAAIPGHTLDEHVGQLLISTLTPLAAEAALQVSAELRQRAADADALRAAHVERARYHADLARRRYLAVDPANRLVASTLEAGWNTALRALNDAQAAYDQAREQHTGQLTDAQKDRIAQLVTDLPGIWNDPATPCANASASPGCCSPTSP
jgi:DNA invertase Pin-like site-specific DNA recombinase